MLCIFSLLDFLFYHTYAFSLHSTTNIVLVTMKRNRNNMSSPVFVMQHSSIARNQGSERKTEMHFKRCIFLHHLLKVREGANDNMERKGLVERKERILQVDYSEWSNKSN